MKKILLLIMPLLFILISCESTTAPEYNSLMFSKIFGGSGLDCNNEVQQTYDEGYIIVGYTTSYGNGSIDVWLIKTDQYGYIEWDKTFGGNNRDSGHSVQQTSDGGYVIVGSTDSYGIGELDVWLLKTDSNGNKEWSKTFGGNKYDTGKSVQQTTDGGYIIAAETSSFGSGGSDVWLLKTDSDGNEEWKQTYGGSSDDECRSVKQSLDGGYIISGITWSSQNGREILLIKVDSNGIEQWTQVFGGNYQNIGFSVQQTTDGGYIVTGSAYSGNEREIWLLKTDSNGNEEWNNTFGGNNAKYGNSVQQTNDYGFIIVGQTYSNETDESDICLIKTDSGGNEVWNKTFGGSRSDWGNCVQQTTDSGYIIAASTYSFGSEGLDVWLVKTDNQGNTIIDDETENLNKMLNRKKDNRRDSNKVEKPL